MVVPSATERIGRLHRLSRHSLKILYGNKTRHAKQGDTGRMTDKGMLKKNEGPNYEKWARNARLKSQWARGDGAAGLRRESREMSGPVTQHGATGRQIPDTRSNSCLGKS